MRLIEHLEPMAVVRLPAGSAAPAWAHGGPLVSISHTAEETSVLCPTSSVPDDVPGPMEGPFVVFRVAGTLDFTQVGVLTSLLRPLADAGVPVVVVSTFDTDWILVRSHLVAASVSVWRAAGHDIVQVRQGTAV